MSLLLLALGLPITASAGEIDAEMTIEAFVTGHQGEVPTISPGENFSYTVNLQCSANDCQNAVVSAKLPTPLVYDDPAITVSPNLGTVAIDGQQLTITFVNDDHALQLDAGQVVMVTVKATLPADASADYNGNTADITFDATADNADKVSDTASVKLNIEQKLKASATKSITPNSTQPSIPGRPATITLGGGSLANVSVDSIVLADPTDPTASGNPFSYLALTGIDSLEAPGGADRVSFDYFNGTDWHNGAAVPIPDDPSTLIPSGVDPATITCVRFTFTKDGGSLPSGSPAKIVLKTVSRGNIADGLDEGEVRTLTNTLTSTVTKGSETAKDEASATISFKKQSVQISASKSFDGPTLVVGKSTTVTLKATTGVMPTSTITINEPAADHENLAEQGLIFGGFVTDPSADAQVTWPDGASKAEITYTYTDGTTATLSTTHADTLPAPTQPVAGFSVTFTSADADGIESNALVRLPFTVTAGPVTEESGTVASNTISATASNAAGPPKSATVTKEITLLPKFVQTEVKKAFNRDWIWASAGATATAEVTGSVASESTIGSTRLVITDNDQTFWDHFDLRRIVATDVPSNATMYPEYFDGTTWQPLTAPVVGPKTDWSYKLTDPQRAAAQGVRFRFVGTDGSDLPAGFTVVPRFEVALRAQLRSAPGTSATVGVDELSNLVTSEVANDQAIQKLVTDTAKDTLALHPTGGGGGGNVDLVDKFWLDPEDKTYEENVSVSALSDDIRTAAIRWGTSGLSMSTVEVVDDPHTGDVSASVFDAFDLVRIEPITAAIDPLMAKDKVAKVELYLAGSGWTNITGAACAAGCDGTFGGYTLNDTERASATAVRLTFAPGTDSDTGAVATNGNAHDRQVRLDLQLRRTLRSDSSTYVLGTSHSVKYNSGRAGVVLNNAEATGQLTTPLDDGTKRITTLDSAQITIYDQPLNVSLTKQLDQTAVGLPQDTADSDAFPLVSATLTATNNTASGVPEFDIADPKPSSSTPWYDYLNLYQLQFAELPAGLSSDDVTVLLALADGSDLVRSYAEAQALTAADLKDVVGVVVKYGAEANLKDPAKPLIPANGRAKLVLTYQLRGTLRSTAAPVEPINHVANIAQATLVSPGGIGCADDQSQTCDKPSSTASGEIDIRQPDYAVQAGKTISPGQRYEDEANGYTVTLTGQPCDADGSRCQRDSDKVFSTARTKLLTLTDDAPTFWNAFDLDVLRPVTLPSPVNQLRLSVLTGVTYSLEGATLVAKCEGNTDLAACWRTGDWSTAVNQQVTPTLPAGITADQVLGLRFEAQRVAADGTTVLQWERPADPKLSISFTTKQRTLLRYGTDGGSTTPVPSTLPGLAKAPGETTQGVTTDQLRVDGLAAWRNQGSPWIADDQAVATTTLNHRVNQIRVEKTPGRGQATEAPRYDLDATIPYTFTVTNIGDWTMTGLELTDTIGLVDDGKSKLVFADVDPKYTVKVNGVTQTGFTLTLDEDTGKLALGVPTEFRLAPDGVLQIIANLRFRDRLTAGTEVANTLAVTSDRAFERCEYTKDAIEQDAITTGVAECAASTTVVAAASTPLTVTKAVKGSAAGDPAAASDSVNYDDLGVISVGAANAEECKRQREVGDGYSTGNCAPITRPGGVETWRLSLTNNGNVAANVVSAIDVLPAPGDTGVTVNTARKSRFTPTFLGNLKVTGLTSAAPHKLTYYYSTTAPSPSCNKNDILNDTKPDGQANCGTTWIAFDGSTPAGDLAKAKAIKVLLKFDNKADGLRPGDPFYVSFDTRTPAYAPVADTNTVEPIAWNSVAVGSRTAYSETFPWRASLITEPKKVGVAIASGQLDLAKAVVTPADVSWAGLLPSSYPATVTCTSLDNTKLPTIPGSNPRQVSLPANGTPVSLNADRTMNLPLFADCTVVEDASQGADAAVTPAKVKALRDYSGIANVLTGWGAGTPAGKLTVTNTYREAGFTVSKAVDGPAALQADGITPVAFKDFKFTASCTLLGHEVLADADKSFSLSPGGSRKFARLPAGADCSVTETYAAGAASTKVVTTQGSTTVDSGTTKTTFSLVAGDETATKVDYTNTYTVGAATITKSVTGPGAELWGNENFEVKLVCTHLDAITAPVFTASHTLTKATPTWTVSKLASGASCTVTETKLGGANSNTITNSEFTVGTDPTKPTQIGVQNYFGLGQVSVTKKVLANGTNVSALAPWSSGEFPVTLTCKRNVDGADKVITRTATLRAADDWTATWKDLPAAASCSVDENVGDITGVTGQPTPTKTITPATLNVPDGSTEAFTVTNNYRAGKLKITKELKGAGASFFTGATFSVTCTMGGTTVYTNGSVSVPKGTLASAELGPIPFGSDCLVTETNSGGADADKTPGPQTVSIVEPNSSNDVFTTNFTNYFSAGRVTVTKALAGAAKDEPWAKNAKFTFNVTCGKSATDPNRTTTTVTITGAGHTMVPNDTTPTLFPVGTSCWASETGVKGGATSTTVTPSAYDGTKAVVPQADPSKPQELAVDATNTYEYAGLTVSKTVAGAVAQNQAGVTISYPTTVTFRAVCTISNGASTTYPVLDQTFQLTGTGNGPWGTWTADKLAVGAGCRVTETQMPLTPDVSYRITRTGITPDLTGATLATSQFALVRGDTSVINGETAANKAAFTNTFRVGKLQLVKQLSPSGTVWGTAPFTLRVSCTVDYPATGTVIYANDFPFTVTEANGIHTLDAISNLPYGAKCAISEPKTGGANASTIDVPNQTIGKDTTVTTKVTNTFNTGSVTVSKVLLVNGQSATAIEPWASASYTMKLSCTRIVDGTPESLNMALVGGDTKVLKAPGFAATWTGLPQDATCRATETTIEYPPLTPTQPDPTVTYSGDAVVGNGTTASFTVTNDFKFGNVQIVKSLAGEAAAKWGTGTFSFKVECTLAGTAGYVFTRTGITLTAPNLTSAAIGPIPEGADCTVTETNSAGATSVAPGTTVVLKNLPSGTTTAANFTNTFLYAGFTVTKTVDNGGALDASGDQVIYRRSFDYRAVCTFNGNQILNQTFTLHHVVAKTWETKAFEQLPSGASCTVTETGTGEAASTGVKVTQNGSTLVDSPSSPTATFNLATGTSATTTAAFTNHFTTGGLDLSKVVTGAGAGLWGAGPFTVRVVCTFDDDLVVGTPAATAYDGTKDLTGGDTWKLRNLPTGANCTVSEPKTGGANATTVVPSTLTIGTTNQPVTITNTFTVGSVQVTKAIADGLGLLAPWKDTVYEFTLSCTKDFNGDGTAESFPVPNPVKTVTGPGSVIWAGLPTGASCAAAETGITYPAGTPTQPAPVVTSTGGVTIAAGETKGQTLTNTFSTAKVQITKTITGDAATTWGTGPFTFTVACTLGGSGSVFSKDVTLTPSAGQTSLASAELGPIPPGSNCLVTETSSAGATSVEPASRQVALTQLEANKTTPAAFTNEFRFAGFTVTKSVVSAALDANGKPIAYDPASFTASCLFKGAEVLTNPSDRAFTLADKQSHSFAGLPSGAACTVTETGTAGAASTEVTITQDAASSTTTATTAKFNLVPGTSTATKVGFANHYTVGSLAITKTVDGTGAARWGGGNFGVRVICSLSQANPDQVFDGVHTLSKADPTWQIDNLPTGADCQVTETTDGGANSTVITNPSPTIGKDTVVETGITNTFTLGAITVTKALTVDGETTNDAPWTQGSYTVELACTRDFDNNGTAEALAIPGGAVRVITGAETATYANLPTGASCSVTEKASSPLAQATSITPSGALTVGADQTTPGAFTVTNDFHTGPLSVLKQLAGAGQESFGNGPFTFTVSCTLAGATDPVYTTTFDLARPAGSTVTSLRKDDLGPIPVGAECLVKETVRGGADAPPAPVTLTIDADAANNVATFTNRFSAGTITLAKTLDGAAKAEPWATAATFKVRVTCEVEVDGERGQVFSSDVAIKGGQTIAVPVADDNPSRVPLGSHCWAAETDAQGAGKVTIEHHDWDSALVVVGNPDKLQTLDLGVLNTFEYAGFTVTKTVDNGGAVDADNNPIAYPASFGYHAQCTFNGVAVLNETFTLLDGGSKPFAGLPAGADCQVNETATGNAASTSIQVTQNGAQLDTGGLARFVLVRGTSGDPAASSVTTAAFTNHFTTGALTITKKLTGAGADAWGKATFTVGLVCTFDTDADPATPDAEVYRASKDLSIGTTLVWPVTKLPTGASCAVSEIAHGGANSTTITNPIPLIGNDPAEPVAVDVTNEFTLGSVTVTKKVLVDGTADSEAEPYHTASFQVRLKCSRLVNDEIEGIDIPGDAYPLGDDRDGVRTIIGSDSHSYDGLPTGATCLVSEVGASLPLPSDQISIEQPEPVAAAPTVVNGVVSNDYHTGSLQLHKQLTGDGVADWADADFTFDVSCTLTDTAEVAHVVFTRTGIVLNRENPDSDVYTGIPVGANCVVHETADGGADVPSADVTVTIADGPTTVATPTNQFNLGALKVTLGLTLDGEPTTADPFAGGSYAIEVTCTRVVNGETVAVPVPGGGSWTFAVASDREHLFTGLPVGASCSVHQSTASLTPQDVSYTPANAEPSGVGSGKVTIGSDPQSPAALGVIDHFRTSTLTVTKRLTGSGLEEHASYPFTISVACTLAEDGVDVPHPIFDTTITLSVIGGLVSEPLGRIPVGSHCVVTETGTGGATIPAEPAELTISEDGPNAVTLTNAFNTGSVIITKAITVDGVASAAEPYASATYTVGLACTQLVDGVPMPVVIPGGATRIIKGAGSAKYDEVPLGADCTVSETGSTLAIPSDQVTISKPKVTVGAEPVESVITNDFRTGTLVVTWQLSGVGTDFAGPATFAVECTLDGATGWAYRNEFTLDPSGAQTLAATGGLTVVGPTLAPIPVGAHCTVTQSGAQGADAVASAVVASGTVSLTATLANEYSAGTLTIVKQLAGKGAKHEVDTEFAFEVTCQLPDRTPYFHDIVRVVGAGSATVSAADGRPRLFPAGVHCWAIETVTGGADSHQVDRPSFEQAATVVTGQPQALQPMQVTAVNNFKDPNANDSASDSDGDGALAFTGFAGWALGGFGLTLVLAGAVLVLRRRRV